MLFQLTTAKLDDCNLPPSPLSSGAESWLARSLPSISACHPFSPVTNAGKRGCVEASIFEARHGPVLILGRLPLPLFLLSLARSLAPSDRPSVRPSAFAAGNKDVTVNHARCLPVVVIAKSYKIYGKRTASRNYPPPPPLPSPTLRRQRHPI